MDICSKGQECQRLEANEYTEEDDEKVQQICLDAGQNVD